jgi:hypothetical protein
MSKKDGLTQKFAKRWIIAPIVVVILAGVIILAFSLPKLLGDRSKETIYVKVKVSQGLWWANTQSPGVWILNGIKVGEKELSLLGKPQAEIIKVSYYPSISTPRKYGSEYNVYATLKIGVDKAGNEGMLFKRSAVSIGSPIEVEFPSGSLTGNIIELSNDLDFDKYITKNVILTKRGAYPWEYNSVNSGDEQTDGNQTVFKVLHKKAFNTSTIGYNAYGIPDFNDKTLYLQVIAEIKVESKGEFLVFGEEQILRSGYPLIVATKDYFFDNYVVERVY